VWGFFTIDVKRGIVYAPLSSPTSDFWQRRSGRGQPVQNSLAALDARTGERNGTGGSCITTFGITTWPRLRHCSIYTAKDASFRPVAQITKMGLLFVFDRVTGEPVYGMEERPVPKHRCRGGDGEDAAVSSEASAAWEEHISPGRVVRPVAGAGALLQGTV
jgi:quinoprotein glucose dehydrogenase